MHGVRLWGALSLTGRFQPSVGRGLAPLCGRRKEHRDSALHGPSGRPPVLHPLSCSSLQKKEGGCACFLFPVK